MNVTPLGLALIQFFEEYRDKAYRRFPHEPWTCGYGHTKGVTETTTCTPEIALVWLKEDIAEAEAAVTHDVKVQLFPHEFDALVSLVYNAGAGTLEHRTGETWVDSTLLKLLNAGKPKDAAGQFPQWDHINGAPNPGLLRRRQLEQAVFLDGTST
jgi:lysozyme